MDFLFTPDVGPLMFFGLTIASFVTAFIGVFTGTAGGVAMVGAAYATGAGGAGA